MEWITTVANYVVANYDALFEIIGVFAVVASLTPNQSDDKIVSWILGAINAAGFNVARARNLDG